MKMLKLHHRKKVQRKIAAASLLDVANFQESAVSVAIDVIPASLKNLQLLDQDARLQVKITNAGEAELTDLAIQATSPQGVALVDPGLLFGNSQRFVRLPRLLPKKSITYKIRLRNSDFFETGVLLIEISNSSFKDQQRCTFKVPLRTIIN